MSFEEIEKRIKYIITKLEYIKKVLDKLNSNQDSFQEYTLRRTLERDCEETIECAIRINQEILKHFTNEIADDYRSSFEKLNPLKILDEKTIEKLANTTGLRNRIAHEYMDTDEKIIEKSAKNMVELYKNYCSNIKEFIKQKEEIN